jgi:hypothetical protein
MPAATSRSAMSLSSTSTLVAIPVYLMGRFHGVVVCANREGGFEELDDELLLALGDHAGTACRHSGWITSSTRATAPRCGCSPM